MTDEAVAVLNILDKRAAGEPVTPADWSALFRAEGYVRLKERELAMGRAFEDDTFRSFVTSDDLLARRDVLRATVADWAKMDVTEAARLALLYLPPDARLAATVYPVIKPATNSFVHDIQRNPAIFIYVETLPRDTLEGIVAHELHHVGYASSCGERSAAPLPPHLSDLRQWLSAFGEGIATVAAAGGPTFEPRLKPDALAEWHRQVRRLRENFDAARSFLQSVARGELDRDAQQRQGMALFGTVGPWYTVGWHMVAVIEQELGRDTVVRALCDQRTLLATYNDAAAKRSARTGESLPLWDTELARAFERH
ncbi:MAG TPA: DUF5700 domain-containing putative Zn-dependent protease [Thermoanaerobaculia bacterium]